MTHGANVVRGECDCDDRLIRADQLLAELQAACGGELPGTLAIPELLELIRRARALGGTLIETIHAQDGRVAIAARAKVEPGDDGSTLALFDLRSSPLPSRPDEPEAEAALAALIADGSGVGESRGSAQAQPLVIAPGKAGALRVAAGAILADAGAIAAGRADGLAERYAIYGADIADAARHLLALLADAPARERSTDLAALARRAITLSRFRAQERSISIAALHPDTSLPARADSRRAYQIILNLLDNAARYAPAGSSVHLEGRGEGGHAMLAIIDEGPPLTPAEQARVFDKFERLGRGKDGGSGLGLYISRRLARAMGGDVTVASSPEGGNRFVLDLPAA